MNTQSISVSGRPGETAQQSSEWLGTLLLKIFGAIVGLGVLAYVGFWIFVWYLFKDWHFQF